jgi:hypothetical protein
MIQILVFKVGGVIKNLPKTIKAIEDTIHTLIVLGLIFQAVVGYLLGLISGGLILLFVNIDLQRL